MSVTRNRVRSTNPWPPCDPATPARRAPWRAFLCPRSARLLIGLDPHSCRRDVSGRQGPGPERGERIGDHYANPGGRLAVPIGVGHVDVEVAGWRGIDSHHRLLDPVGDAAGIRGMYRAVAGAFPGGVVDAAAGEVDEAELHDAQHHEAVSRRRRAAGTHVPAR